MFTYIARLPRSVFAVCAFLFVAATTVVEATPPALFYSLLPLKHSQETCMKRAHAAVASEIKGGKIDKRADNISLVSDDFNIGVHCRNTGKNKSFATIVVAHRSSFDEARGVALNIRGGMEKGIFE